MDAPAILTPDQRLRVFVSSTLSELGTERAAARRAIERLCLVPVMFELGARPYPPRSLYLAYLRQSHIFVGIYGEQYGWTAPGMDVSGLEDELRHSGGLPRLIYVKNPAPGRAPQLVAMLDQLKSTGGVSYKAYSSADELESLLAADLAVLLSERFTTRAKPATLAVPRPPSEFVGRQAELAELAGLVTSDGVRLVTLTGPGGIGKTRLGIEIAYVVADRFPDAVVFVPLAGRGPDDFLEAISAAVGLKDLGQRPLADLLADHLHDRRALLILDNAEQLLPAAGQIARLLEQTHTLRLLVTSRTALRLTGEEEYPVPPLGIPRITRRVDDVMRAEAAQLFCRRVASVRHGYRLTEHDATTVAMICRRLDGLPLALELAAARANVLTIDELAARLDKVLDLSARSPDIPQRQRTLRQTMDWSYQQLPEAARQVFAQAGVFAGPFSLGAAEAVCVTGADADLLDTLGVLVDHSLLRPEPGAGPARFSMLQIVREYARTHLQPSAFRATAERHACYYRDLALSASAGLRGANQPQAIARLDLDAADIGAALDWLTTNGRQADVAEMCWAMWSYHWARGTLTQGRRWTSGALAGDQRLQPRHRGRLLASDGFLAAWQRDYQQAAAELLEAREIASREGDHDVQMLASIMLVIVCGGSGDEQQARTFAGEGLRLARAHGDQWAQAEVLTGLCWLNAASGRFAGQEATFDDMITKARDVQDPLTLAMALTNLAELRIWQGRHADATALLTGAIASFADLGMVNAGAVCLHTIAFLATQLQQWKIAAQLQAASDAAMDSIGAGLWPPWLPRRQRLLTDARRHLGNTEYDQAWATGQHWTFDDAGRQAGAALQHLASITSPARSAPSSAAANQPQGLPRPVGLDHAVDRRRSQEW